MNINELGNGRTVKRTRIFYLNLFCINYVNFVRQHCFQGGKCNPLSVSYIISLFILNYVFRYLKYNALSGLAMVTEGR